MIWLVGEVVELKSGGPSLTIRAIEEDQVTVDWFDKATLRREIFFKGELQPTTSHLPQIFFISGENDLPEETDA